MGLILGMGGISMWIAQESHLNMTSCHVYITFRYCQTNWRESQIATCRVPSERWFARVSPPAPAGGTPRRSRIPELVNKRG